MVLKKKIIFTAFEPRVFLLSLKLFSFALFSVFENLFLPPPLNYER